MALARRATWLIGKVIKASREEGVEVAVNTKELDTYLTMYFTEQTTFMAYDEKQQSKEGDIIIIKKLPENLTRKISHEVIKVVYPLGDITDPVTGRKVMTSQYRDDMTRHDKLFGPQDDGFTVFKEKLKPRSEV